MPIYSFNVERSKFIEEYVGLVASIFNLTELEILIISSFIKIFMENRMLYKDDKSWNITFSSINKKRVQEECKIKNVTNLHQYIKKLRDKNVIIESTTGEQINKLVIPQEDGIFGIKFIQKGD